MSILRVRHVSVYRYASPVRFGDHWLMFRPRDSHDLRLLDTSLVISPSAAVRWLHDAFGNSVAIASFVEPATELCFTSTIRVEHFPAKPGDYVLAPSARHTPISYSAMELVDLGPTTERHYPDPDNAVGAWAGRFVEGDCDPDTLDVLIGMTQAIKAEFRYLRRERKGTQEPAETLATRSGTCRDFALFMMEAARSLGFAARFVSGYLYDGAPADRMWADGMRAGAADEMVGVGATHAWLQIYLPGAGWVEFDPTNGLVGGENLIRIAVARDPSQALPLHGTYAGSPDDFLDLSVSVAVSAEQVPN
jgi:transglutaminase-like putative cysteine protease